MLVAFFLTSCTTIRSYAGYVVTETKNVELPGNGMYATKVTKATSGCMEELCTVLEVTLLYHGHTLKAHCQLFDTENHCNEIEVGISYPFSRSNFGEYYFLSLDAPHVTLSVDEEHN